jgi:choloylglycine hydrolase
MKPLLLSVSILAVVAVTPDVSACSAFLVEATDGGSFAVGKSYDWSMDQGLVLTNARGLEKRSLVPGHKAHKWTARYGSLTFNQYGAQFPNGGMNEVGLVVEVLWLNASEYPGADERPAVSELQWIQWALDTQGSVEDLATAAPKLRVAPVYAKVHYFACDASGRCATFEYLGGKLVVHRDDGLPVRALTNHPYDQSLRYYQSTAKKKKAKVTLEYGEPFGSGSLARFVRAGRGGSGPDPATTAFRILDSVSQGDYSVWNIVYVPSKKQVQFRTWAHRETKTVSLSSFDLGCDTPPRMLDIQHAKGGDMSGAFTPYTVAANRALVGQSLKGILDHLPAGTSDLLTAYPSTMRCLH